MVETRPVGPGLRLFGLVGLLLGFLCPFLHHLIDLGTMPTRRPYSWKKMGFVSFAHGGDRLCRRLIIRSFRSTVSGADILFFCAANGDRGGRGFRCLALAGRLRFGNQLTTGGKFAFHSDIDSLLVISVQRADTVEQGRKNL